MEHEPASKPQVEYKGPCKLPHYYHKQEIKGQNHVALCEDNKQRKTKIYAQRI